MSNIKCYKVKCITNLHVGDGEANYNIIDNEIERDPVNDYPMIFSTGVKGALREHFEGILSKNVDIIFGKEVKGKSEENERGNVKFTNAYLLALPMRASQGKKSHYMVTSTGLLEQLIDLECHLRPDREKLEKIREAIHQIDRSQKVSHESDIAVEGMEVTKTNANEIIQTFVKKWIGNNVVILPETDFRKYRYPVQARNRLVNGKSDNLWYEEYVPHNALFYLYVIEMAGEKGKQAFNAFESDIKNNLLVQFGANATVGFGLTKLEEA